LPEVHERNPDPELPVVSASSDHLGRDEGPVHADGQDEILSAPEPVFGDRRSPLELSRARNKLIEDAAVHADRDFLAGRGGRVGEAAEDEQGVAARIVDGRPGFPRSPAPSLGRVGGVGFETVPAVERDDHRRFGNRDDPEFPEVDDEPGPASSRGRSEPHAQVERFRAPELRGELIDERRDVDPARECVFLVRLPLGGRYRRLETVFEEDLPAPRELRDDVVVLGDRSE
jgi:hypothetical protein